MEEAFDGNRIVNILIKRDEMTASEAYEMLYDARHRVLKEHADPAYVLEEDFGLEPDYVFDLLVG